MNLLDTKVCRKCKIEKDRKTFWKNIANSDGLHSYCKECNRLAKKDWEYKNPESKKKYLMSWIHRNKEKIVEYGKSYYLANKDKVSENVKNWRSKNKAKFVVYSRNYRKAHPERGVVDSLSRRARVKNIGGKITQKEWIDLKLFYANTCLCCRQREPNIKLTLDHVVPIRLGGENKISNSQPLCQSCNSSKGIKIIDYRI